MSQWFLNEKQSSDIFDWRKKCVKRSNESVSLLLFQVSGGSLNETDLTILDPSYAQFSSVAELQAAEWVLPGCRYYKLNLLRQSSFLLVPVVYCSLKLSKIRPDLDERPLRKSGCCWRGIGYQTCFEASLELFLLHGVSVLCPSCPTLCLSKGRESWIGLLLGYQCRGETKIN